MAKFNHKNQQFKTLVRKGLKIANTNEDDSPFKKEQEEVINRIPEIFFQSILEKNFDDNFAYAERVILKDYDKIESLDDMKNESEHFQIDNLDKASAMLQAAIKNKSPIIFLTDNDNDGSMSQAVVEQFKRILSNESIDVNIINEFCRPINGNSTRGFTYDLANFVTQFNNIDKNAPILFVSADNGISNKFEQEKILSHYPNAKFIVTDHHNPEPELVVADNERATIVNPHYFKADYPERYGNEKFDKSEFFQKNNISGAATLGVLVKYFVKNNLGNEHKKEITIINRISKNANMLDYVDTHSSDKPQKPYEIERFLGLQPITNTVNNISTIMGKTPEQFDYSVNELSAHFDFNTDLVKEKHQDILNLNTKAQCLLSLLNRPRMDDEKKSFKTELDAFVANTSVSPIVFDKESDFGLFFNGNTNYLEQLRPIIFQYASDNEKTQYEEEIYNVCVGLLVKANTAIKRIMEEMRKGKLTESYETELATINVIKPFAAKIFNRKFITNTYNELNLGFVLNLDNVSEKFASGSFRSLYNISDIIDRKEIEKEFKVKITTPGHERAAGFILESKGATFNPEFFEKLTGYINNRIAQLKQNQNVVDKPYLVTDLKDIKLLGQFNRIVNGAISHFESLNPIIQLNEHTSVLKDGNAISLKEALEEKRYGWLPLQVSFGKEVIIFPREIINHLMETGFKDYVQLSYLNAGTFIVQNVVSKDKVLNNYVDLRYADFRNKLIDDSFKKIAESNSAPIPLSREDMKSSPFFRYAINGDKSFAEQENLIINIIDLYKTGMLSVVDTEANGLGSAKLNNIGVTSYFIDDTNAKTISYDQFRSNVLISRTGDYYHFTDELLSHPDIRQISASEYASIGYRKGVNLFTKTSSNNESKEYYYIENAKLFLEEHQPEKLVNINVSDIRAKQDIRYNRHIKAEMVAYLIKEADTLIPASITGLTGITQEHINKYGLSIEEVDDRLTNYFKSKEQELSALGYREKPLLGAHNTPYDSNIIRTNLPHFYNEMRKFQIYDSLVNSSELYLAYTDNNVISFKNINRLLGDNNTVGIPEKVIFNANLFSRFNIIDFILDDKNGTFPDRSNQYLLEKKDGNFYFVDKDKDLKYQLNVKAEEFVNVIRTESKEEKVQFESAEFAIQHIKNRIGDIQTNEKDKGFTISQMQQNYVRGSAQLLGITKSARNIIDYSVKSQTQLIELEPKEYPNLSDFADYFKIFQRDFDFRRNMIDNFECFKKAYPNIFTINVDQETAVVLNKKGEPTIDKKTGQPKVKVLKTTYSETLANGCSPEVYLEEMKKLANQFFELNKDTVQDYADEWMYQSILNVRDITATDMTKDLLDLISYQTSIPLEHVERIANNIIEYKKHFGINEAVYEELHVNGPYSEDHKGDILFENALTFSLYNDKTNNPYYQETGLQQARQFAKTQGKAALTFFVSDHYDEKLLLSGSFAQLETMNRNRKTDVAKAVELVKEQLVSPNKEIIAVKPNQDFYQSDSILYLVKKAGVELTQEQIEKDVEFVSKVSTYKQLASSESARLTYQYEYKDMTKQYDDLKTRYTAIVDNNSRYRVKKIIRDLYGDLEDRIARIKHQEKQNWKNTDKDSFLSMLSQEMDEKLTILDIKKWKEDRPTQEDIALIRDFALNFVSSNLFKGSGSKIQWEWVKEQLVATLNMVDELSDNYSLEKQLDEYKSLPESVLPLTLSDLENVTDENFIPRKINRLNIESKYNEFNAQLNYDKPILSKLYERVTEIANEKIASISLDDELSLHP